MVTAASVESAPSRLRQHRDQGERQREAFLERSVHPRDNFAPEARYLRPAFGERTFGWSVNSRLPSFLDPLNPACLLTNRGGERPTTPVSTVWASEQDRR